jgi:peptidoglycan-N-acetylmuramic acid deacetylase
MKYIKLFSLVVASFIVLSGVKTDIFANEESCSWYCKRVADNKQPPLPSEFSFINDYDGIWLNTKRDVADDRKVAYLTFDAGYENGNVSKILDVLKEKNVPGAFFILINLVKTNPELVKRMTNEGHFVCNHTAHHKDMSKITDKTEFEKELTELNSAYRELTGEEMRSFYRPPEGRFSRLNLEQASKLGYKTVFWSFAYADWDNANQPSPEYAKKKILDNIHNGAVLLLHPTSLVNAQILGDVIDEMRNRGYEFGTLEDLYNEISKN